MAGIGTRLQRQRPHATGRHQRAGQRPDRRGYPDDGVPWGTDGWASGDVAPTAPTVAEIMSGTIPDIQLHINGITDGAPKTALIESCITYEEAHQNRVTLVAWLEAEIA